MTDQLSVVNQALTLLGERLLTDLNGTDDKTQAALTLFDQAAQFVLIDVAPPFAKRYEALDPTVDVSPLRIPDCDYVFNLPDECVRILRVKVPGSTNWLSMTEDGLRIAEFVKIAGRYLGANHIAIELVYIADENITNDDWDTTLETWDTLSIEVLAAHLAVKLAMPLTESRTKFELMGNQYAFYRNRAMAIMGQSETSDRFRSQGRLNSVRR